MLNINFSCMNAMALQINRIVFPNTLLVSLLLLLSGYTIAGVEILRQMRISSPPPEWWFYLQLILLCTSPICIWRNLGSILGTIALLGVSFWRLDLITACCGAGLGLTLSWYGLQAADIVVDNDRPLGWWEWLAGLGMVGVGLVMGLAVFNTARYYYYDPPNWLYGIWTGLISYALAVTGSQLQSAEIPPKMSIISLILLLILGLVIGGTIGHFTIHREIFA